MPSYYIQQSENRDVNPENLRDGDYVMAIEHELLYRIDQIDEPHGEAYCLLIGRTPYDPEMPQYSWFPIRRLKLVSQEKEVEFKEAMEVGKELIMMYKGKI